MSTETVTQATLAVPTRGRFGEYGGRYVPEVLIPALDEPEAWTSLRQDLGPARSSAR